MTVSTMLALAALAASVVLVLHITSRLFAIASLVVSSLEVLISFGVVHLSVEKLPIGFIFGLVLLAVGGLTIRRVITKPTICATTVILVAGAVQLLAGLHLIHYCE